MFMDWTWLPARLGRFKRGFSIRISFEFHRAHIHSFHSRRLAPFLAITEHVLYSGLEGVMDKTCLGVQPLHESMPNESDNVLVDVLR